MGALSGLASTGTSKLLGSGLYLKKGGTAYKMVPQGEGQYLKPHCGTGFSSLGDGLYIKSGTGFTDGCGLLLGQNNPILKRTQKHTHSRANTPNNFVNITRKAEKQSTTKEGNELISVRSITGV